jgi:WD40 repeat protein
MDVNAAIRRRKLGLKGRLQIDFVVDKIRLKEVIKFPNSIRDELDPFEGHLSGSAPLASSRLNSDTVAVAHEDGYVNLLSFKELKSKTCWSAHDNAIFDIKSSSDNKSLITASGDTTIRIWDVERKKETLNFSPHFSSVKSLSVYDINTFASGSRDGSIKIHDLRIKDKTVIIIRDAHRNTTIRKAPKFNPKTDPISCVTSIVFDPYCPRLYSAGANDATLKLWDLRKSRQTNKPRRTLEGHILFNQPYHEINHPARGVHCGYSHLLFSSGRLYAACSDNIIYCYEGFTSSIKPIKFTNFGYSSYLRLAIMDDRYLISGGKLGGGALVWSLMNKCSSMYYPETTKQPIGELRPDLNDAHDTNVIETDWDSLSLLSMRDDGLVFKWTMQHVPESERKKLASQNFLAAASENITIQMADIIGVNVLRPNHRLSNSSFAPITV